MNTSLQKRLTPGHTKKRDEFSRERVARAKELLPEGVTPPDPEHFHRDHEAIVQEALRNGMKVPPEVMKEYPHLHPEGVTVTQDRISLGHVSTQGDSREALARLLLTQGFQQGAALATGGAFTSERLLDGEYEYAVIPTPGGKWVTATRLHGSLGPWLPAGEEASTPARARELWEGRDD